jgi:hypothetical protein
VKIWKPSKVNTVFCKLFYPAIWFDWAPHRLGKPTFLVTICTSFASRFYAHRFIKSPPFVQCGFQNQENGGDSRLLTKDSVRASRGNSLIKPRSDCMHNMQNQRDQQNHPMMEKFCCFL